MRGIYKLINLWILLLIFSSRDSYYMQKQNTKLVSYLRFFDDIDTASLINAVTQQNLKKHNIILLDQGGQFNTKQQSYKTPKLQIKYTEQQATIVQYEVIIAKFKLQITMINFDSQAPEYNDKLLMGVGSFGSVRLESSSNKYFIVKRQAFNRIQKSTQIQKQWNMNANKYNINQVIYEYCFYKICSLYKIGPAVDTSIGFDLLCYKNHIEFHLQFCDKIYQRSGYKTIFRKEFKYEQFERQMKQNLKLMHELKLIHKDVKPDNILYSHQYNRYVLTDFGLSHSIEQNIGEQTKTYYEGSPLYMCEQMKKIYKSKQKQGQVDLYDNDRHGLRLSFKQILLQLKKEYEIARKQKNKIQFNQQYKKQKYFFKQQINLDQSSVEKLSENNLISSKRLEQSLQNKSQINIFDSHANDIDNAIKLKSTLQVSSIDKYKKKIIFQQTNQITGRIIKQKQQDIKILQSQDSLEIKKQQVILIKDSYVQYQHQYQRLRAQLGQIQNKGLVKQQLEQKYTLFTTKSKGYYQYLKLKFIAIKNNLQFYDNKQSWNHLNLRQILDILNIILQYSNLNKKKQVYDIRKQIAFYYEQKLILAKIKQKIDRKEITIAKSNIDKVTQLKLKNYIRIYGQDIECLTLCEQLYNTNKNNKYLKLLQKIRYKHSRKKIDYTYDDNIMIVKQLRMKLTKLQNQTNRNQKQILNLCIQFLIHIQQYEKIGYITIIEKLSIERNADVIGQIINMLKEQYKTIISIESQVNKKKTVNYNMMLLAEVIINKQIKKKQKDLKKQKQNKKSCNAIEDKKRNQKKMKIRKRIESLLHQVTKIYINMGKYQQALKYSQNSILIYKRYYGEQHPDIATSYHQISVIYSKTGKYQQALKYSQNSILIYKRYYGEQHPDIATSYHQISVIYSKTGKYQQALKYSQNSILIYKRYYGEQHPDIATSYHQISVIYSKTGKYQQALKYSQNSILIYKRYYGEQHPDIATSYHQISVIYSKTGKYQQALKYSQNSILIYKRYYGEQHPDIATSYHQISVIYSKTGKYQQALKYSQNSILIYKRYYGEQHPDIATSYHQISVIYSKTGKYQQALKYSQNSILIYKRYYGEQHPDIATSYHQISVIYSKTGKYQQALKYSQNSILIYKRYYGEQHPDIATSYHQISVIYSKTGKYQQALKYSQNSILIYKRYYGEQHPDIATSYHQISVIYSKTGKYQQALKYSQNGILIYKRYYGEQHPDIMKFYHQLTQIYSFLLKDLLPFTSSQKIQQQHVQSLLHFSIFTQLTFLIIYITYHPNSQLHLQYFFPFNLQPIRALAL